jgi:hypothetical protein
MRFNGTKWSELPYPGQGGGSLVDVWGYTAAHVWVVGGDPDAYLYTGGTWKSVPMPNGTVFNANGIWGSSTTDVWLVGGGGTVLHLE